MMGQQDIGRSPHCRIDALDMGRDILILAQSLLDKTRMALNNRKNIAEVVDKPVFHRASIEKPRRISPAKNRIYILTHGNQVDDAAETSGVERKISSAS